MRVGEFLSLGRKIQETPCFLKISILREEIQRFL